MAKPNAMLARLEAQMNAKYMQKLEINSEFDMIAFIKTVYEEFHVGSGRAERLFNTYRANKMELAEAILEDSKGDPEILLTKRNYAAFLKERFGAEAWERIKEWFPLLEPYW